MPQLRGLKKLKLSSVALVPRGSNPGAHIALFKTEADDASADNTNPQDEVATSLKETNEMTNPETAPDATATEATAEVTTETTDEATTDTTVETPEATTTEAPATAPEPVAASAESVTKAEAESIRKELSDAQAKIAKMEADARKATFIAKAEKDFAPLGSPTVVGTMLMKIEDGTPFDESERQQFERLLKGAVARAEAGEEILFKQISSGDAEPTSAQERLDTEAQALVTKGDFKTVHLAKEHILKTNTALATEVFAGERS